MTLRAMALAAFVGTALVGAPAWAQDENDGVPAEAESQSTSFNRLQPGLGGSGPGMWAATALASEMMGVLTSITPDDSVEAIERKLMGLMFDHGLANGDLPLETVNSAFSMVLKGEWPDNVDSALESTAARVASEVNLEQIFVVNASVADLGPPPNGGDVLGGTDYEQ